MSQPEWWEEQHARFLQGDRRRRYLNRVAAVVAVTVLAGAGYYLIRRHSNSGPCGPRPSGTDVQAIIEVSNWYECVADVARAKPPITVFRGKLNSHALTVANAYTRAEWVRRDCAAATALFHAIKPGYSPECGSFNLVGGEDVSDAYLVSGPPRLQHHCTNDNYYRLRASQCFVYQFIQHTNKLIGAWEYVIIQQTLWLRPVHNRWRVVLESDEGDQQVPPGDLYTSVAKQLWARRLKPTRA